jgi:hypothetical protein
MVGWTEVRTRNPCYSSFTNRGFVGSYSAPSLNSFSAPLCGDDEEALVAIGAKRRVALPTIIRGRHMRPAIQITAYPAGRDQFRAMVGDRVIVVSDQPFEDAARALLAEVSPATPIVMHLGRVMRSPRLALWRGLKVTRRVQRHPEQQGGDVNQR